MQIASDTYFIYQIAVIAVLTIILVSIMVVLTPKESGNRVSVGLFGGMIVFFIVLCGVGYYSGKFTYEVIRIYDDCHRECLTFIRSNGDEVDKNGSSFVAKCGHSYIENLSHKDVIIEPLTYSRYRPFISQSVHSDSQTIPSNSISECTIRPDYYFAAPNTIVVKTKRGFQNTTYQETKWLLRYID